jgi:tetratricopeptide (TPR) repeat protein
VTSKVVGLLLLCGLCATAETNPAKPVDCSQLLTWIVGGVPAQRVLRLTRERGVAFRVNDDVTSALSQAGEKPGFIRELPRGQSPDRGDHQDTCPAELTRAATFVAQQRYDEAEPIIRKLLIATPANADLHFALGFISEQRGDLDDAFDAYADAAELNPEFPEVHSGMSYIFSRSNDGNNAIAEARTALSLDPGNAEAYRYLGLALFVSDKYSAAQNAFDKSLVRDPNRGETYYDLGLLQVAENELTAAAESYRKAIQLSPHLGEAQTSLGAVLRVLGQQGAVAAERKSKPDARNPSN